MACERGVSFGYNNLVADMRSLAIMRKTGAPVVFDATHSVQKPGGKGAVSGGAREMVPVLARAACGRGRGGAVHGNPPRPAERWSDGPNAVPLKHMKALLETWWRWTTVTKKNGFLENNFGDLTETWPLVTSSHRHAVTNPTQYEEYMASGAPRPCRPTARSLVRGGKVRSAGRRLEPRPHCDAQVSEL
jgi:hypothetical protein